MGDREFTADKVADALRQQFGDYDVSLVPTGTGDDGRPHVHVTKGWNREVQVSFNLADGEMELEPTSPNNLRQMLFDLLIIPLLFTDREQDASWNEMGEEVTGFLEETYGTRTT